MKGQISIDNLDCVSDLYSYESTTQCDSDDNNMWLYGDSVKAPCYDSKTNYLEKCCLLNESKNVLEELLKDHIFANTVQDSECTSINMLVKRFDIFSELPSPNMVKKECTKKARRSNQQIEKKHECPLHNCGKTYGTRDALNFHIKRKHPSYDDQRRQERKEAILSLKDTKSVSS